MPAGSPPSPNFRSRESWREDRVRRETTLADIAGNRPCVFVAALLHPSPLRGGVGGGGQRALSLASSTDQHRTSRDLRPAGCARIRAQKHVVGGCDQTRARCPRHPHPRPLPARGRGEESPRVAACFDHSFHRVSAVRDEARSRLRAGRTPGAERKQGFCCRAETGVLGVWVPAFRRDDSLDLPPRSCSHQCGGQVLRVLQGARAIPWSCRRPSRWRGAGLRRARRRRTPAAAGAAPMLGRGNRRATRPLPGARPCRPVRRRDAG